MTIHTPPPPPGPAPLDPPHDEAADADALDALDALSPQDRFASGFVPNFVPIALRRRDDGWSPERQVAFVEALAQSGCVRHAARAVGMSVRGAYALRQRGGARSFRAAWDAALDFAIKRLSDAALSRAIHGVVRPVVYKGEVVARRRYFDERLTQFLLRYRDPLNYGRWLDRATFERREDGDAASLSLLTTRLMREGWGEDFRAARDAESGGEMEGHTDMG